MDPNKFPAAPVGTGEVQEPAALPAHVVDFTKRLETLRPAFIKPMGDLTGLIDHSGPEEIKHTETVSRLDHAYVDDALVDTLPERKPGGMSFEYKKGWSLGREDSQHATFFGTLTVQQAVSGGADEGEPLQVPVAVKTFPFPVGSHAVQEYALLQDLAEKGLLAVKPVGIIMDRWASSEPCLYLLVRMESDLESLDAQDWTNLDPNTVTDRVAPVVDTLQMLHGQGVFNRELGFANVAVGEAQGSRFVFDLENARSHRVLLDSIGPEDPIPPDLLVAVGLDFIAPRKSLEQFVYPNLPESSQPKSRQEQFKLEKQLLFNPYRAALESSDSLYKQTLLRAYDRLIENEAKAIAEV